MKLEEQVQQFEGTFSVGPSGDNITHDQINLADQFLLINDCWPVNTSNLSHLRFPGDLFRRTSPIE